MSKLTTDIKLIGRIGRWFRDDRLKQYGVDSLDSDLILALERMPGLSQDRLCEQRMLNKSTMARHLASLEERKLIRRTVQPEDRRVNNCELTEEGHALVPLLRKVNDEWSMQVTKGFSAEEIETLQNLLDRVLMAGREYMKGREKE